MKQFRKGTRERIVSSLRGGERTVNDLVAEIGLTDNAIRSHLEALEQQGLVSHSGFRAGTRKPHHAYKLTTKGRRIFFEACEPLLNDLLAVLDSRLAPQKLRKLLREAGHRLAKAHPLPAGRLTSKERIDHALGVLKELGGQATVEQTDGQLIIQSSSCPWGAVTAKHPEVCLAAEALLSELIGVPVKEHCMRVEPPRCHFRIHQARA
jgi:predicted ArsR family transcriptional regulator